MNGSLWLWGFLAVAVCWGVGVYNRLMRMQVRGLSALRSVEKYMHRCTTLIHMHADQLDARHPSDHRLPDAVPTAPWGVLVERTYGLSQSLKDAKGTHLSSQLVANLGIGFDAMQQAWRQWCDGQPSPGDHLVSEAMHKDWEGATLRVQAAREGLNQILSKYNAAIAQFPARLIVKVMGFKPAGLM